MNFDLSKYLTKSEHKSFLCDIQTLILASKIGDGFLKFCLGFRSL